jgi:hypothetical protein
VLDWDCSDDSRRNGSKRDCGSGLVVVHFDLGALPKNAEIEQSVLTLYREDGAGEMDVYARQAISEWSEGESNGPPECEPTGETIGETDGDEWTWDLTALLQDQRDAGKGDFGVCLILKKDVDIAFGSRECESIRQPALAITYR